MRCGGKSLFLELEAFLGDFFGGTDLGSFCGGELSEEDETFLGLGLFEVLLAVLCGGEELEETLADFFSST